MTASEARIAGADTREALETPTVRLAARSAVLLAAPFWAAAAATPSAWSDAFGWAPIGGWLSALVLAIGFVAVLLGWRWGRRRFATAQATPGLIGPAPFVIVAALALAASAGTHEAAIAISMPALALLCGLGVADAAILAARATLPGIRPAATGIVTVAALLGIVPGTHLLLAGTGAGLPRAAAWTSFYLAWGAFALRRAARTLPRDRRRITVRSQQPDVRAPGEVHALDVRAVTVRFGPDVILDHATLTADAGRLVALVGGNGAGKSTLLRVAAGFTPIETGRVLVAGEDVTTLRPEERAGIGLSFVSGARPVFPELSVLENLRVAAYRTHQPRAAFNAATEALLELVPTLAERRHALAGVLSGGEQRLLAIAQSLYRRPSVLLADELTLGLDVDARHAVMDLLQVLAEQGVAVVCVDHDLPSLLPRAHRAAVVADGTIRWFEKPVDLLTKRADLLPATFLVGADG